MEQHIGKRVKVINGACGLPIGTIDVVASIVNSSMLSFKSFPGNSAYVSEVEFLAITKEELSKDILELKNKIEILKSQIKFLDENNLTEFDENQFKVYQTLSTLEKNDISQIEKARIIASLINDSTENIIDSEFGEEFNEELPMNE